MKTPAKRVLLRLSSRKLKAAIEKRDITQSELARTMGIPRQTVSRWMHAGLSIISVDTLATLREALSVEESDLMVRVK